MHLKLFSKKFQKKFANIKVCRNFVLSIRYNNSPQGIQPKV